MILEHFVSYSIIEAFGCFSFAFCLW